MADKPNVPKRPWTNPSQVTVGETIESPRAASRDIATGAGYNPYFPGSNYDEWMRLKGPYDWLQNREDPEADSLMGAMRDLMLRRGM